MRARRVTLITYDYPPASNGGIGSFSFELANQLAKEGVEVCVVTRNLLHEDAVSREKGVSVYRLSFFQLPLRHMFFQGANLSKILKIVKKERPDVIHTHASSSSFILNLLTRYAPVLNTVHGSRELLRIYFRERAISFTLKEQARFLSLSAINFVTGMLDTRNSSGLAFVAQHVLDDCLGGARFKKTVKANVVYNGIDFQGINKLCSQRDMACDKRDVRIAFVGRLVKYKGVLPLLRTFVKIRDQMCSKRKVKLIVFGNGPLYTIVKQTITQLGLSNDVTLRGWIERSPLLKELSSCDLLVHPSFYEACPMNVLEAYALGIPVVAQSSPWSHEFVKQIRTGFEADVCDAEEFSEAVLKILNSSKIYVEFSRNATEAARTRFSSKNMVDGYLRFYEELV